MKLFRLLVWLWRRKRFLPYSHHKDLFRDVVRPGDASGDGDGLKTVVYQSFRTKGVPLWIARCMRSVQGWAELRGFDYSFVDDRMFSYVPYWYMERAEWNVQVISDLARLELARQYLANGYDRAIWVDADVIVYDPDKLVIDVREEYAFCREVWIDEVEGGGLAYSHKVNNALSVFVKGNSLLDFYIHACKSLVRNKPGTIQLIDVGTGLLTHLHDRIYLPLITSVGLFSPVIMNDIAEGTDAALRLYMKEFAHPTYAANLCGSVRHLWIGNITMHDYVYDRVIDRLLETRGEVINQYLSQPVAG